MGGLRPAASANPAARFSAAISGVSRSCATRSTALGVIMRADFCHHVGDMDSPCREVGVFILDV